jgi:hypothetical protein
VGPGPRRYLTGVVAVPPSLKKSTFGAETGTINITISVTRSYPSRPIKIPSFIDSNERSWLVSWSLLYLVSKRLLGKWQHTNISSSNFAADSRAPCFRPLATAVFHLTHIAVMATQQIPPNVPFEVKFRILIIGRANAGKTTILQRICDTTESPKVYRADSSGRRKQVRLRPKQRFQSHHLARFNSTLQ